MRFRRLGRKCKLLVIVTVVFGFTAILIHLQLKRPTNEEGQFGNDPKTFMLRPNSEKVADSQVDTKAKPSPPGLLVNRIETVFVDNQQSWKDLEENFYRYLEKKDVKCHDDRRLGYQHDGGWNVCFSSPFRLKSPCLVYSFGIGNDWRFEDELEDRYRCSVLAFDPSIKLEGRKGSKLIKLEHLGLAGKEVITKNGWKLKSFGDLLYDHGHDKTTIDYLKMDIEFWEWDALDTMVIDGSLKNVKQMGFEIHTRDPLKPETFNQPFEKDTFLYMHKILSRLERLNFRKFNYRMNPFCSYTSNMTGKIRSRCYELHYVNLDFVEEKHVEGIDRKVSFLA